jgi:Protein of unknown function (DUF4242)
MPEFLVERYVPRIDAAVLDTIGARLEREAAELRATGIEVQWLRSVATADEETCFCFFSAPSPKEVAILNERAGLECARIGEVLTVERSAGS